MKILGRDPAAILYGIQSLLAVLVAFHAFGLTADSADWVMLIVNGLLSLAVALTTRPFVVAAITGAVQTVMTGIVSFGIHGLTFTQEQQGVILAALAGLLALLLRQNQEPRETVLTRA